MTQTPLLSGPARALPDSILSAAEFAAGFDLSPSPLPFLQKTTALSALRDGAAAQDHDDDVNLRLLSRAVAALSGSPQAQALLSCARADGVMVGHAPFVAAGAGYYDAARMQESQGTTPEVMRPASVLAGTCTPALARSEKGMALAMAGLLTALRRHWHERHGHAPSVALRPADYVDHARLLTADCLAVLHLVAWELRGAGHGYLWRFLLAEDPGDIATAFEAAIAADAQAQFNGRALKAAFNQWFADHRRTLACDLDSLELYDAALVQAQDAGSRRMVASQPLARAQLQQLGLLADGQSYLAGCIFTSAWYGGCDDEQSCALRGQIEQDVRQLHGFSTQNVF